MNLFRVEQTGYGTQSLRVFGDNSPSVSQRFQIDSGNHLLTIDSIADFAGKSLRFSAGPRARNVRSARVERLLQEHD
jgi:hypothetical protein